MTEKPFIQEAITSVFRQIGELYEKHEISDLALDGLPTGLTGLDKCTGGLTKGDLIVIGGDYSSGKTALALTIANFITIAQKESVAFYTLETTKKKLIARALSSAGRIDSKRLLTGNLRSEDWPKLTKAVGLLSEAPLYIREDLYFIDDIIEDLERIYKEQNIKLAIIDYFQLLSLKTKEYISRDVELGTISRKLKELAKKLDIPIAIISTLNRQIEKRTDKRPLRGDIRDCGAVEYDADIILFLYRDEIYNRSADNPERGSVEIQISKGRMGSSGVSRVCFIQEFSALENMSSYEDFGL